MKPTATSRLSATPIPKLLAHAQRRTLTGTVVFESPDRDKSAVYFEAGAPAKVMTKERVQFLGEVLQELGLIDERTHQETLGQATRERRLHGQVLTSAGKLTRQDLLIGLREQLTRKVVRLAAVLPGETIAGYYDGQNLIARWGGPETTPVPSLGLIWPTVCASPDHQDIDRTMKKLEGRVLRIHRAAQVASFKLERTEQALLDVMRGKPQSIEELDASGFDRGLIRRLVYAFAIAHFLDLGSKAPPPLSATSPRKVTTSRTGGRSTTNRQPATPGKSAVNPPTADTDQFRSEIEERAESVESQTYYEILGVPPDAAPPAIQAAFFQLARRWHPDRVPKELDDDVRDLAMRVFSRMSEAHGTLTDPELRKEYDRVLTEGGGTAREQEQINSIVKAAAAFQKAEILHKRGKLEEAEAEAKVAFEGDDQQPEYGALYAWICAQRLDPEDREGFARLIEIANESVNQAKEHVRIRYYRGMILKRAGRPDLGMRDFRFVAEADPRHTDAQREIRLYRMRKKGTSSSRPPPATQGGLLGKLFKK